MATASAAARPHVERYVTPVIIQIDLGRLARMDTDLLIEQAAARLIEQKRLAEECAAIVATLDSRFPGEKMSEHIIREFGIAERQVKNEWFVPENRGGDLFLAMGNEIGEYFERSRKVTVLKGKEAELLDAVPVALHTFFKDVTIWKPTQALRSALALEIPTPGQNPLDTDLESKLTAVTDDGRKLLKRLSGLVKVNTKITVKVKPIER